MDYTKIYTNCPEIFFSSDLLLNFSLAIFVIVGEHILSIISELWFAFKF